MTNEISKTEQLGQLRVEVRNTYLKNGKDDTLDEHIRFMAKNRQDFYEGAASPRRGLFVVGKAGTGKSTSVRRALSQNPDLQPKVNEYGETNPQYLSVKLKKKSMTRDIVAQILQAMHMPADGLERSMTDLMMDQFAERGIWLLHIDELQHTVRSNSTMAFKAIQDLLKGMLDDERWPLHMILSGVPKVARIRDDLQIRRRSLSVTFHPMQAPANNDRIRDLIQAIAVERCGLELAEELGGPEFYERLCKATHGCFGTMIETIQMTCFDALERGRRKLTIRHFARHYEMAQDCPLDENMFLAPNFRDIELEDTSED